MTEVVQKGNDRVVRRRPLIHLQRNRTTANGNAPEILNAGADYSIAGDSPEFLSWMNDDAAAAFRNEFQIHSFSYLYLHE